MAIHEEQVIEHSGQAKELDAGAIDMILDNLQISQYVYPVKSTIRELGSNGVDSIREKNTAIEILTGKAKVEDYYYVPGKSKEMDEAIKANPGVYKDSRFDPLYYDLECLSRDDKVQITYTQHGNVSKDTLTIRDWGVGLGDYRLQGYLKIGYSTKRLSKKPLGKFGLGAKSPLSMGVPYYVMTSVHNRRKFRIMVYARHWEDATPPGGYTPMDSLSSDLPEFRENSYINFYKEDGSIVLDSNGLPVKVYYEDTDELNYTEVTVECKKHYITDVKNAVQSQLLYFNNVEFNIVDQSGQVESIEVQAPILYEDEGLILSDNNQYSKPHIVINNVSYGYINFEELELEQSQGNIGIKVSSGEVDVTQNRENVIWNDGTREVILKRFKQASRAAKKVITESFVQEDFIEWLGACSGVLGYGNSINAKTGQVRALIQLQHIAKLKNNIHPDFKPEPDIKYYGYIPNMFPGLIARHVKSRQVKGKKATRIEVDREETFSVSDLFTLPVYVQETVAVKERDLYLLTLHPEGFILIRDSGIVTSLEETLTKKDAAKMSETEKEFLDGIKAGTIKQDKNDPKVTIPKILEHFPKYSDVITPSDTSKFIDPNALTLEEKRRREQRIVVQTPRISGSHGWVKMQPKIEALDEIDKEFYWGNQDDKDGILAAAQIIGNSKGNRANELVQQKDKFKDYWITMGAEVYDEPGMRYHGDIVDSWKTAQTYHWADPDTKVLLGIVAKENIRYVAEDHYHITEFFNRIEEGVITMADSLIAWNTARILKDKLDTLNFMKGMATFDNERFAIYANLTYYVKEHYTTVNQEALMSRIRPHLDKVVQLQQAFRESNSDDSFWISNMAQELFGSGAETLVGAMGADLDLIDFADQLLIWAAPIKDMLNLLDNFDGNQSLSLEQEEAVRQYIEWRTS